MLQNHGDCIQKCALVLGKEFVFCLGGAERIEDGSYALLEFAIRGIEGVVLLEISGCVGSITRTSVPRPAANAKFQIFSTSSLSPFRQSKRRMATTNVLVDDGEQQVRLAAPLWPGRLACMERWSFVQ